MQPPRRRQDSDRFPTRRPRWFCAAAAFALGVAHPATTAASGLVAGAAEVDVTPPVGTPMAGYYHSRAMEGVHDPLYSKAVVLQTGETRVALVALDLITTHHSMVAEARAQIEERTGIPGSHVMISATHSHTGPVLADASKRASALAGEGTGLAREFAASLPGKIADSVAAAVEAAAPATVSAATGHEDTLAFNRRFHMKDGSVGWNPGRLNPEILRPAGPIDPEVPFALVRHEDGPAVAAIVNYACHLDTVGGFDASADYPYTLANHLRDVWGEKLITQFTIGCAGDINHINVAWGDRQKGHTEAARIGTVLAGAVVATAPDLRGIDPGEHGLRVASETVELPLAAVTDEDVAWARETFLKGSDDRAVPFLEIVRAYKIMDVEGRAGKPLEVEVQAVALGRDLAWVSLPGEIFVELGLALKSASPFEFTHIAELANGSVGYIPTRQAYAQGQYEVVSARMAAGSGELLVEVATRLLRELYR